MALNWKNGGSWEAIPEAAIYSTYAGTFHIEYQPTQDVGIDGTMAAANGIALPRLLYFW